MMHALRTSETSVNVYQTTRRNFPKDRRLRHKCWCCHLVSSRCHHAGTADRRAFDGNTFIPTVQSNPSYQFNSLYSTGQKGTHTKCERNLHRWTSQKSAVNTGSPVKQVVDTSLLRPHVGISDATQKQRHHAHTAGVRASGTYRGTAVSQHLMCSVNQPRVSCWETVEVPYHTTCYLVAMKSQTIRDESRLLGGKLASKSPSFCKPNSIFLIYNISILLLHHHSVISYSA
jgi:hypothetical protein